MLPEMLDLATMAAIYAAGLSPFDMVDALLARLAASQDQAIFISIFDREAIRAQVTALLRRAPQPGSLPIWGVPFAVKDNLDVAGLPTTAACPEFAYHPEEDAFVVARLKAAGGIVLGKTNLDQFATGLNGARSPYGAPRCVFNAAYISGGSSSGSAVAVAAGLASFALGTDTAGSGRVPAALNNIVGIKPTPGRVSTRGLLPACRTLDCVTIFAGCVADGAALRRLAEAYDSEDAYSRVGKPTMSRSRPRIGVLRPEDREFYGDNDAAALYERAVHYLSTDDAELVPFDFEPFCRTARLLYDGPWVAERVVAIETFFATQSKAIEPTVRAIMENARRFSASDAFRGLYALETYRRQTNATWEVCDALLLPTTPTTYTVDEMLADPVVLNSRLGHYTNFANLLGLAAIAVPAGFTSAGLPFGVMLVGPGSSDEALGPLADGLHRASGAGMGRARAPVTRTAASVDGDRIEIAVVGAHLSGMPLNGQLVELGARFVRATMTQGDYRLFVLPKSVPPKPGLIRDPGHKGRGVPLEIWSLEPDAFGRFVAAIPQPLGVGRVALADGSSVAGFLCEHWAVENAVEVPQGWRAYVQAFSK